MRYLVDELEALGFTWAYRVVNARAFGIPQRRQRVLLLASALKTHDPHCSVAMLERTRRPFREVGCAGSTGLKGCAAWAGPSMPFRP